MVELEAAFAVVSVLAVAGIAALLRACSRRAAPPPRPARRGWWPSSSSLSSSTSEARTAAVFVGGVEAVEAGLDDAALRALPKVVYNGGGGAEQDVEEGAPAACCAVCLGEYATGDVLRVLPQCAHAFHLRCVDRWLRLHPTCPVCRSPPVAAPVAATAKPAPLS